MRPPRELGRSTGRRRRCAAARMLLQEAAVLDHGGRKLVVAGLPQHRQRLLEVRELRHRRGHEVL